MKLVKLNKGQSIAVFRKRKKEVAAKLMSENRVDFITEANYCKDGELDKIVKRLLRKWLLLKNFQDCMTNTRSQ